jgi:hypothetical protein
VQFAKADVGCGIANAPETLHLISGDLARAQHMAIQHRRVVEQLIDRAA